MAQQTPKTSDYRGTVQVVGTLESNSFGSRLNVAYPLVDNKRYVIDEYYFLYNLSKREGEEGELGIPSNVHSVVLESLNALSQHRLDRLCLLQIVLHIILGHFKELAGELGRFHGEELLNGQMRVLGLDHSAFHIHHVQVTE